MAVETQIPAHEKQVFVPSSQDYRRRQISVLNWRLLIVLVAFKGTVAGFHVPEHTSTPSPHLTIHPDPLTLAPALPLSPPHTSPPSHHFISPPSHPHLPITSPSSPY